MPDKPSPRPSFSRRSLPPIAAAFLFALTGCLSSYQKHTAALAAATTPVLDQAAEAYRSANALYDLRVDYDAVSYFDRKAVVYNPRSIQPLLSDRDIDHRLAVLAAFQTYTRTLVAIVNGVSSPALDAAATSVGSNLTTVGNDLAPTIEATFGLAVPTGAAVETTVATTVGDTVTTTTSTSNKPPADPITPTMRNGIATAANALGQFLGSRKIKRELPSKIQAMDPNVQLLCTLLSADIDVLAYQETLDYNSIIDRETLFVREHPDMAPQVRRERIMTLPEIVRRQRASEQKLTQLRAAIVKLALTHHALVADVQGNNPESLKMKLADLSATADNLGKFNASLPSK